ncbi:MAG: flagellar biosynthesis protein FlhF [Methylophilaceae bacterium]|nr:MAG: flagellar biosynthesis protein FlhF [Methylophilaceae bacterium]
MNIKRFFGKNSKLALAQVREALGDDAVILSNRTVKGGNEIMAFSEAEMNAIATSEDTEVTLNADVVEDSRTSTLEDLFKKRMQTENASIPSQSNFNDDVVRESSNDMIEATLAQTKAQAKEVNTQIANMMTEIRNMRTIIESQLAEISWGATQQREPIKSKILGAMLTAGFSPGLSKQLVDNIPKKQSEADSKRWVQSVLLKNLATMTKEDEMLDKGGIYAIVGPTGVGKTTTTAKLAARFVMKHGTENIGLITTDSYRIGGHEQLRIYGKILGVMVHSVKDEADLKIALRELKNKHTILIDTVGVSQRDKMVSEQIAMLSNKKLNIKKLLCLNATSTGDTLIDVIKAYKGQGLTGCIMTKIDEAITLGNVLDVMIREKLKLYYVTNGQRVPEDLHLPHKQQLVHRTFSRGTAKNSPFQLPKEDQPLVVGNTVRAASKTRLLELDNA